MTVMSVAPMVITTLTAIQTTLLEALSAASLAITGNGPRRGCSVSNSTSALQASTIISMIMAIWVTARVPGVAFDGGGNSDNMRFYGDVTGRIGYTWGTWMVYAKGGFAWLNVNNQMRETIYWNRSPDWQ